MTRTPRMVDASRAAAAKRALTRTPLANVNHRVVDLTDRYPADEAQRLIVAVVASFSSGAPLRLAVSRFRKTAPAMTLQEVIEIYRRCHRDPEYVRAVLTPKARRPFASDWEVSDASGLAYSPSLKLYWLDGRAYDHQSAEHNGLIGAGAKLRQVLANSLT